MSEVPVQITAQRTLLVVDDQASVGVAIAHFLETNGYRTLRAESGLAAIELVRKEPQIDGVLLDVQMPGLNGLQVCVQLLELARELNRPIKVWFITGAFYRELNDECAKAGGISVFLKPFDWPQMLGALSQGLASLPPPPTSPTISGAESNLIAPDNHLNATGPAASGETPGRH